MFFLALMLLVPFADTRDQVRVAGDNGVSSMIATGVWIAIIAIGIWKLWPVATRGGKLSARELSKRFVEMGEMYGKSEKDIIAVVGEPSAIHNGYGYRLLQWQRPGYHVALKFDLDGMFQGIASEYAA